MVELIVFVLVVAVANLGFLAILESAYLLVSRRRAKVYLLVDHLTALAQKGLPIHAGLRALAADLRGFMGTRLEAVARRVEEGEALGAAMLAAPRTFPPLLRSMVALGERSGNFAGFLLEMSRSYRRATEMTYQSVYPFLYPLILTFCVNVGLTSLTYGMAPKFQEILEQVRIHDPYRSWWPVLVAGNQAVFVLCLLLVFFVVLGGFSPHVGTSLVRLAKRFTDRVLLAVPLLGTLLRDGAAHHFALCTGLFLRAGAALPDAVAAVAEVERNEVYRRKLRAAAGRLREGARLSDAVRPVFRSDLLWFVEAGEAAGSLPEHLLEAAVHYETRVRFSAALAMRSIVPVFVVLNGLLILATFLLIFLPMREVLRVATPP
jgi:type II secretory pathway component PulF